MKDPELRRLIMGGAVLRDLSRGELARVFDHWRACPSERMHRRLLRESRCG